MPARRDVLNAAKAAVRAYARDPSKANAIEVDVAWRRVRALDGVAGWRKPVEPARQTGLLGSARTEGGSLRLGNSLTS